jgi:hypothetical protein
MVLTAHACLHSEESKDKATFKNSFAAIYICRRGAACSVWTHQRRIGTFVTAVGAMNLGSVTCLHLVISFGLGNQREPKTAMLVLADLPEILLFWCFGWHEKRSISELSSA